MHERHGVDKTAHTVPSAEFENPTWTFSAQRSGPNFIFVTILGVLAPILILIRNSRIIVVHIDDPIAKDAIDDTR